jgi:hypothetical protein
VRLIGLEPTRREAPDPKSGVATNYTTGALLPFGDCKNTQNLGISKMGLQTVAIWAFYVKIPLGSG